MFERSSADKNNSGATAKIATQEVERKWLVSELPNLVGMTGKELIQGYITIGTDGTEVRLRQKGDQYFQTIKTDGSLVRGEIEIELTKGQYDSLWATTEGRRLEKTRYEIPFEGFKIELDVYRGTLSGLIVAEVEFPSVRDSETFTVPTWFGTEVTEDKRYKNKNLAINGITAEAVSDSKQAAAKEIIDSPLFQEYMDSLKEVGGDYSVSFEGTETIVTISLGTMSLNRVSTFGSKIGSLDPNCLLTIEVKD